MKKKPLTFLLDDGFSIAQRSCRVAGESGTCMFVWECLKTEGKHLGMCMDGFMFGSCCVHDDDQNQLESAAQESSIESDVEPLSPMLETSTLTSSSDRPTRPSRPSKPTHAVKWPNFHLIDKSSNDKIDKNEDNKNHQHFVSLKVPEDPRPALLSTE